MAVGPAVETPSVDAASLTNQVVAWLKARIDESGAETFVLGLSGGIDSAVVCGLCARAVGPGRVVGVIMPSASNPDDAVQAAKVAQAFGVKTLTVDLTNMARSFQTAMPIEAALDALGILDVSAEDLDARRQLAAANVRPRLRMTTLYYVANLVRGIVTGTGNKSEVSIGYFTKHGDGGVDLFPLIDFYKYEVRAIASHIGVPQSVIDRPPSAGLWEGQTDEAEIGLSYDILDSTLERIEQGNTDGIDAAVLDRVSSLMRRSEHKRRPAPAFRRQGGA